ncbi:BamG2: predicted NADH-quinone oxidoreductase, subunit E [Desulfosarcina variabilis str. Montpellier]|uniref:(2Fe-2S) ferredoxin domain-containing protein n=1 Tax=Desulfosarcina variabilis TaxID=2300 RepID=UPI003AFAF1A6
MSLINSPAELETFRQGLVSQRDPNKPCITLCSGSACHATGSHDVATSLAAELEKQGLTDKVDIRRTGCHGFCERGPIIVIHPDEICYFQIKPEDVPEIITETIQNKKVIERLLFDDPATNEKIINESKIPFYENQERIVFWLQQQRGSQEHRRLPGHRRVLGPDQGPVDDESGRRARGSQEVEPARPGRRRISGRAQVGRLEK